MDYPLGNLFLAILRLFIWTVLIFLVFRRVMSSFGSQDLSGWGKANALQAQAFRTHERFGARGMRIGELLTKLATCAAGASSPTGNSAEARPSS